MRDPDSSTVRLLEGILAEFADRCRRGEKVRVDEYLRRHPQLADELRDALPALRKLNCLTPPETDGNTLLLVRELPEQIGEYRIVSELGRGGMGIVYQAIQGSLGRRVALKVISRPNSSYDNGRERFSREARIAAHLHHSNIVPVFGAGEEGDVVFYAMQYIEGESLDGVISQLREFSPYLDAEFRWITALPALDNRFAHAAQRVITGRLSSASDRLGVLTAGSPSREPPAENAAAYVCARTCPAGHCASVAKIGVQVANALAHAHSQGILHRDIKPSNLILDRQGIVWLTDFGLAQHDGEPGLTSAGDLVGTLRYLAPERFRGSVDTRSDVYALGLVLYELLTFRPPFEESNRQALMGSICELELPSPRKVRRGIPPDLETIVLKATAKDPSHRYPSASELAQDLSRFLEGRPVLARPLGSWGRFWRWRRRNPVVARLAGLLLLVLLTSLLVVTWQWRQAEQNLRLATELEQTAIANANEAVHQRDRAQQNLKRARQAVDDYLTTISESNLLDVPTLEPVRAELLSRAREFYEGFVEHEPHDPQLKCELAATYIRLSQVTHDVDGDWVPFFERGLTLLEQSQAAGVALVHSRSWREGVYNTRAGQLKITEPDRLLQLLERALVIWSQLVAQQPEVVGFKSDLAGLRLMRGLLNLDAKRPQLALEDCERSRDIREELINRRPGEVKFLYGLSESYALLGALHLRQGKLDDALHCTTRAKELLVPLARDNPSATRLADMLAAVHQQVATIRLRQRQATAALSEFQLALGIQQRLADEYPYVPRFQENLAASYRTLGRSLFASGQVTSAEDAYSKCLALIERRLEGYPEQIEYRHMLAEALIELGRCRDRSHQHEAAETAARRALIALNPGDPADSNLSAQAHYRIARALFARGIDSDAVEHFESSIVLGRNSVTNPPRALAEWIYQSGRALQRIGRIDDAEQAYHEALEMRLANGAARNGELAMNHFRLATALQALNRTEEADTHYRAALVIARSLRSGSDQVQWTLDRLLDMHRKAKKWQRAEAILAEHRQFQTQHSGVNFGGPWSVSVYELPADAKVDALFNAGECCQYGTHCIFDAAAVDFRWLGCPPRPEMPASRFALVAESELTLAAGQYKVHLDCRAGARVLIDDRVVLDQSDDSVKTPGHSILSTAGTASKCRVEFAHGDGPARLRLWFIPRATNKAE